MGLVQTSSALDRRHALLGLVSAAAATTLGACDPTTAGGWQKSPHNPLLGGVLGTCFDVSVLKDGNVYRMWFSWRPKQSIAYCESANGYRWSDPVVVLAPNLSNPNEVHVNRPSVLKLRNTFHMWFTTQSQTTSAIAYARSPDGLNWERVGDRPVLVAQSPWERSALMCPDVLWDEASQQFRMWYSGGEQYEPDAIGHCTSADGAHWTRVTAEPVFRPDPSQPWERAKVTGCNVHRVDAWHYMFYIGFSDMHKAAIGLARSRDGLTEWQRHPNNPILRPPGKIAYFSWERDAVYKPSAVRERDGWSLWYNARRRDIEQIGMASHAGLDLGFR